MPNEQVATPRLERIERRIDAIVDRLRHAPGDPNPRVARRVDALTAREATARARSRAMATIEGDLRNRAVVDLEYELDEIEVELAIAEAQLAVAIAQDAHAFGATVEREIVAYGEYVEWMQAKASRSGADLRPASEAFVRVLRERRAVAAEQLRRFRDAEGDRPDADRAHVYRALAELDRVAHSRPIEEATTAKPNGTNRGRVT